jgi:hypothetical protein
MLLTVSLTVMEMDWKVIPPVFVNRISTHQAVPEQFSMPVYDAAKSGGRLDVDVKVTVTGGAGVFGVCVGLGLGVDVRVGLGVGGGVNTGRAPATPVTLAYLPDNQHTLPSLFGLRMIHHCASALRPTTSATSPARNTPTLSYTSPGPARQFVFLETRICGGRRTTDVNVGKGVGDGIGFVTVGVGDLSSMRRTCAWAV